MLRALDSKLMFTTCLKVISILLRMRQWTAKVQKYYGLIILQSGEEDYKELDRYHFKDSASDRNKQFNSSGAPLFKLSELKSLKDQDIKRHRKRGERVSSISFAGEEIINRHRPERVNIKDQEVRVDKETNELLTLAGITEAKSLQDKPGFEEKRIVPGANKKKRVLKKKKN